MRSDIGLKTGRQKAVEMPQRDSGDWRTLWHFEDK